jgi:DNA-binding transcriptional LysR family regulator
LEHGSFSAAARALGHAPSAVSRQVGALEERLRVRLLHRARQGLALTEAGAAFPDRSTEVARRVAEAETEAMAMGSKPFGVLRVACTTAFGRTHLVPILPAFLAANPELRVSLTLGDQPTDMAAEGIDVAIRFSEQIDDPSVVSRRLALNRRVICAAPDYLRRAGVPTCPEEVERHNCLTLSRCPCGTSGISGRQALKPSFVPAAASSRTAPTRSITQRWRGSASRGFPPTW